MESKFPRTNQFISDSLGFSLLELMCALALSALLVFGLIRVNREFQEAYNLQKAWLKVEQEAYFLSSYLLPKIARTGFSNCDASIQNEFIIQGYDHNHLPGFITEAEKVQGDVLVLALCIPFEGRQQFKQLAYYVGETNRRNKAGERVRAFYEKPLGGHRIELEEGIRTLKMVYGLGSKNGEIQYYPASLVADWDQVVSVKLNFSLASVESVLMDRKKQLLEKPWVIYVALRKNA